VPELLSNSPSIQEILWNFSRSKDEKRRLTLTENPHFYAELPTSPEAYGDSIRINPTEDFRYSGKFYVLVNKPELVYIVTDQILWSLGNFWCPNGAIIFKGLGVVFCLFSFLMTLGWPDICGRLMGGSIVKASLRGASCGLCTRQRLVSIVPRTSGNRYGLQPITTQEYPWMSWICLIGCLSMPGSVEFDFCICVTRVLPNSPVRCDVIIYSTASANIGIIPGPLATNVYAAGV
jgi:hypothetical protein